MGKRTLKNYIVLALKGIAMGASDIVPGVSGGTIAFITGIYEELVNSIKSLTPKSVIRTLKEGFSKLWKFINGNFLLAIFVGILVSIFSLSNVIKYFLENEPILVWSFFFGLILASAVYIARKITTWHWDKVLSLIIGVVIAYFITTITPAETTTAYWFIFLSGALAICAMILPGISGSFILLLLGKYQFILGAVSNLKFDILATLMFGALIGIVSFANLLSWFLRKFHDITITLLAGFMIGALNKIWPWKHTVEYITNSHGEKIPKIQDNVLPHTYQEITGNAPDLLPALGLFIAGIVIILILEFSSGKQETSAEDQ